MSLTTPHRHLGFTVHFDELEPAGVITMRQATWEQLQAASGKHVHFLHEHEPDTPVADSTTINATSVGPISGPDAGTGPLVPAGSLEKPAVLVPNAADANPNPVTINTEAHGIPVRVVEAEPTEQPAPTDPVPAEPTEVVASDPPSVPDEEPVAAPVEEQHES